MRGLYGSQPVAPVQTPQQAPQTVQRTEDGKTFQDVLQDFVKQVDQSQHEFDAAIRSVERGETDNLHRVMLAQSQAQLSLKLAVEVRNKLIEAYKEVNRTQF
jgi:flagellar hook-basal body complex protein FliE